MTKVCIYGVGVARALDGNLIKGGSELQMSLLAKALANNGIPVIIVDPTAQNNYQPLPNLMIESVPKWNMGIRGIRFFTHRLPGLIKCLKATGATVFYSRGFSYQYIIPLYVAMRIHAKFAIAIASDTDVMGFKERFNKSYKRFPPLWSWVSQIIPNEVAFPILIRKADIVCVQHQIQMMHASSKAKKVIQLNNILDDRIFDIKTNGYRNNFIVVGDIAARKDLHLLIPVIKRLPNINFEFVGDAIDKEGERIKLELQQYPNVTLHGAQDRVNTLSKIAHSKALINTSRMEGFANTFLEAWVLGTPVLSLFADPGDIIKNNNLGYVCYGNVELLAELLQRDHYELDFAQIKKYVLDNHSSKYIMQVFINIFNKV